MARKKTNKPRGAIPKAEVTAIREDFGYKGLPIEVLITKYNRASSTLTNLLEGKTYRHRTMTPELAERIAARLQARILPLSPASVRQIRYRRAVFGHTFDSLASDYRVSTGAIKRVLSGETHTTVQSSSDIMRLLQG